MKIQRFLRVNFQSKCPSSYFILSLFILAFGVLGLMFVFSIGPLNEKIGSPIFDLRPMGYSYEEALYILSQLDDEWRSLYLFPQLFLFDILYPFLLAIAMYYFGKRLLILNNLKFRGPYLFLISIPFWSMIFDYAENTGISLMLQNSGNPSSFLVKISSSFSFLKSSTSTATWIILLGLSIRYMIVTLRKAKL